MYTIYDGVLARKVQRDDFDHSVVAAKHILMLTPTRNGYVAPVSIFNRHGVLVAVVSDDANSVTVHRFDKD